MRQRLKVYDKDMHKQRVTITVHKTLLEAANLAVSEGRARSVSEWIGQSMAQRTTGTRGSRR